MVDVLPPRTNPLLRQLLAAGLLLATSVTAGVWYYFTPRYTQVGYQPRQPVPFSHATHAEQLGLDCRYCHDGVERSWYSNLPAGATCLNCHNQVLKNDPRLAPVRESVATGQPVAWVHVHRLPDFVYFNHAVHVNRGVSCLQCHGAINRAEEVAQVQPLSMSFCRDCHRDPAAKLRPPADVFNLDWQPASAARQLAEGRRFVRESQVQAPDDCSTCHR